MSESHANILPRGALNLAGGLVIGVIALVATARIFGMQPEASPVALRAAEHVAPVESRDLVFSDRPDGSVGVRDVKTGQEQIAVAVGSQTGFIRGVMRGLARERRMHGVGAAAPFRLTLWKDGELSLTDSATGRNIELSAFGATNRAAFAALLAHRS